MVTNRTFVIAALILTAITLAPATSHAYLDPASGSIVYQVAVGGLLAAAAAIRLYWRKIKTLFSRRREVALRQTGRTAKPGRQDRDPGGTDASG